MPDNMGIDAMKEHMTGETHESAMIPKSICPDMEFKPGDEIVLKVKNVQGDMLEVEYAPEPRHEMSPEEAAKPETADKMKEMPADKMREALPKAEREGY